MSDSIIERYHLRKCFQVWISSFSSRMLDLLLTDYWAKRLLKTIFRLWRQRSILSVKTLGNGESRCIRLRSRWHERHSLYYTSLFRCKTLSLLLHACRLLSRAPRHDVQIGIYYFTIWRFGASHQRLSRYKHLQRRALKAWRIHVSQSASLNRSRLLFLSKSVYTILSRAMSVWLKQARVLGRISLINRNWLACTLWKCFIHWRSAIQIL